MRITSKCSIPKNFSTPCPNSKWRTIISQNSKQWIQSRKIIQWIFFSLSSSDDVLLSQAWDAFEGIEKEKGEDLPLSLCVSKEDLDESVEGAIDCRSMLKIQEEAEAEMTRYTHVSERLGNPAPGFWHLYNYVKHQFNGITLTVRKKNEGSDSLLRSTYQRVNDARKKEVKHMITKPMTSANRPLTLTTTQKLRLLRKKIKRIADDNGTNPVVYASGGNFAIKLFKSLYWYYARNIIMVRRPKLLWILKCDHQYDGSVYHYFFKVVHLLLLMFCLFDANDFV